MRELLQAVCKPVVASPEFKERLLKYLTRRVSDEARGTPALLGRQRRLCAHRRCDYSDVLAVASTRSG